jgi:hypothetical protein
MFLFALVLAAAMPSAPCRQLSTLTHALSASAPFKANTWLRDVHTGDAFHASGVLPNGTLQNALESLAMYLY